MEKENPVCPGSGVYSKIKREWIADADALCVNIENVVVSKGSETQEVVWFLLSPVPGILEARTLEWVAISFSSA